MPRRPSPAAGSSRSSLWPRPRRLPAKRGKQGRRRLRKQRLGKTCPLQPPRRKPSRRHRRPRNV